MPNNFEFFFNNGKELLSKKAYPEAIIEFKEAMKLNKNDANLFHFLGEAYLNLGNDSAAKESFNKSIQINPNNRASFVSLSKICDKIGNVDEAIISMKKAIELDLNNAIYYIKLGDLFFKKSLIKEGVDAYNNAFQLISNPEDEAYARILLRKRFSEHNLIDDAITQHEMAMELAPGFFRCSKLSDLYILKGDEKKALDILGKNFLAYPTDITALKDFIIFLKNKNEKTKIKEILKQSANSFPLIRDTEQSIFDDENERFELGRLLTDYGSLKEAKPFLENTIRLYPESLDNRILFGEVLLKLGLVDESMDEFEYVIQIDPTNYDKLYWISDVIRDYRSENIEGVVEGISLFSKFESIKQDDEEIKNILGLLYFDIGEYGLSIQKFMKAIFLTSRYTEVPPPYHTNLAEALTEAAEITEGNYGGFLTDWAISEYQNALDVDTEYYDARLKLIKLLQKERRNVEALNVCIEGLNQFPNDLSFQLLYAMELVKKGDIKQVLSLFQNEIKELDSASIDLYEEFLEVLINNGYYTEAEKIARNPDNSFWNCHPPYDILAKIFIHQGRFDEAISIVKQHIEKSKGSQGYFDLGEVYFINNQFDDALECYKSHLKTDPKHFEAHKRMAEIFTNEGLIQEALIEYKAIIDLNPKNIEIYDEYKKLKLKEAEKAASEKEMAILEKEAEGKLIEFEKNLRKFLELVLKRKYTGKYWEKIKFDKKEVIDQKINDHLRRNPHLEMENINPLDFFDIWDYYKLIRGEWSIFEEIFRSRDEVNSKIELISPLRNSIKHVRPASSATIKMGVGSIEWFELIIDKWKDKILVK
jgi:tetratricopeptide (TPR) repeat protein